MKWMLAALVVLACMVPMVGALACSTHAEQAIATVSNFFGGTAVPGPEPGHDILVTSATGAQTIITITAANIGAIGGGQIMNFLQLNSQPPPVDVNETEDVELNA